MASAFVAHASRALTAVRSNPYAFNSVTGFSLFSGSDAIAQKFENEIATNVENESAANVSSERDENGDSISKRNAASDSRSSENNNPETVANVGSKIGTMATSCTKIIDFDCRRLLSAGAIGVFFGGFVYPFAYARLDALWKGVTIATTLKKSLTEIATVGIFVNSISISTRGLLLGRDTEDVAKHTIEEMPGVTVNDARVWLPYNIVCFSVIPIYIRPATTSLMEACWQTYISLCAHNYTKSEHEHEQEESSSAAMLSS